MNRYSLFSLLLITMLWAIATESNAIEKKKKPAGDGWSFGASCIEYFGDFEYYGDLLPTDPSLAAKWSVFGKGIGRNMSGGVHAQYCKTLNEVATYRFTTEINLYRGMHYTYEAKGQTDMSGASFLSAGLGLQNGFELYPARDNAGFYFYAGLTAMVTIQNPRFKGVTYHSVGLLPMADLGIGYLFDLKRDGALRIDLVYGLALFDYGSKIGGTADGKWGLTGSLDGIPGLYEKTDGTQVGTGYHPGDLYSSWFQDKKVLQEDGSYRTLKRIKWPDSTLAIRFAYTFPEKRKSHQCRCVYN